MAKYKPQPGLFDEDAEYKAFVEKFKPKKTTDDCYTPQPVYDAVLAWARKELPRFPENANVVRPFWPGGDFMAQTYEENDVVVDNPPFSILSRIFRFYHEHDIPFLLFAPALTLFNVVKDIYGVTALVANCSIVYENGAIVCTSFVTNMDSPNIAFRLVPDLKNKVDIISASLSKQQKKVIKAKSWPDEIVSSALLSKIVQRGIDFKVTREHCKFVKKLDNASQTIFGGGFFLSRKAAAERMAAERMAAERAAAERIELSEEERRIVNSLGK